MKDKAESMDQFGEFETRLTSVLRPVRPSAGYVDRLKHSLRTAPYAVVEKEDLISPLLILVLGAASALLTFLLLRRFRP